MSATAAVSIVTTTAKTLDVLLPDEFTAAVDRANALIVAAENLSAGPQQLHAAMLERSRTIGICTPTKRPLANCEICNSAQPVSVKPRDSAPSTTSLPL